MNFEKMKIKNFISDEHWNSICEIHDAARPGELEGSAPQEAFVPLKKCYKEEGLLDDKVYIGEVNGTVVGFVAFDSCNITWLYIHPSHQGNKYGRQLLQFAVKKTKNPTKVLVLNKNLKAISLYESEGFTIVKSKKGTIPIVNVDVVCYRMEKNSKEIITNRY
ncbi:MAG: GNAT family N-acetyltransferase [bacterium]|jgi:ribosomal protein S18 acetylase RimI-like enzyme|nr:N-acetyltransferase [Candidatus Neomarinimicrobiota bacterium]HIL86460.1 N-acetyltransferase [Candidatus Neomarinimicrobiota bacterium]|tara:strand:- start:508 stop:996 length:489 start_codon:yes stop_codon:yes gene_type:complete